MRATKYRTSATAGTGIVQPSIASPLSDLLRAPSRSRAAADAVRACASARRATAPRSACTSIARSSGRDRDLGRLPRDRGAPVRNYGTDPDHGAPRRPGDLPRSADQQRRREPLDLRLARRTNMAPYCYDPASTENLGDPANRNNYGVNINRNFFVGSIFDGFQGASTGCWAATRGLFALRARDAERGVGSRTCSATSSSEQHPLVCGYFMWPPGACTPARVRAAVPAVRHAELLRPGRTPRARRHQSTRTAIRPQRTGP